jgi:hypothetical protein
MLPYTAVYQVYGVSRWPCLSWGISRTPYILHWIGSDLLRLKGEKGIRGIVNSLNVRAFPVGHLADSHALAEELALIGIQANVVHLLPKFLEAGLESLPEVPTVLSYWSDNDPGFYGADTILRLAEEFPDIRFLILKSTGQGLPSLSNVTYLGFRTDMPNVYREASVLIRLPHHDSLSAMVLEMLVRGRYVIYNRPLPGCRMAGGYEEVRTALLELRSTREMNLEGATYVKETFSMAREAQNLKAALVQFGILPGPA